MRSFAASYPLTVQQLMHELEGTLKNDISKVQQVVALLEDNNDQQSAIVQQAVAQLPEKTFLNAVVIRVSWAHHVILLDKVKSIGQRFWYILNTLGHGNSRNVLAMQIESGLFERQIAAKKTTNFTRTLPCSVVSLSPGFLRRGLRIKK